jgi:uncharacterized protein (DUF1786 family)
VRILAIDVGTGTQDILLFDPSGPVENSPKLVVPSPTAIAADRIRRATAAGRPVILDGAVAGGGPCWWALEDHLRAGLPASATAAAALTFDDDLDRVRAAGVDVVDTTTAARLDGVRVTLADVDLPAIRAAFAAFDVDTPFDGVAVGVFDHGTAPSGVSDRRFRFDYLASTLARDPDARAFAATRDSLPPTLTRARAALHAIPADVPAVFMDNGPAAALGALHDPLVARARRRCIVNVGNMHVLAFLLDGTRVVALFEHHTGELSPDRLATFVAALLAGTIDGDEVYASQGHGAHYVATGPFPVDVLAVTGPRREPAMAALAGRGLRPHAAAPHGDMMISGCFGLLDGFAYRVPAARDVVAQLHPQAAPA